MKKRPKSFSSKKTSDFESSLAQMSKIYRHQKKTEKNSEKTLVINPTIAKLTFIILMVLIFLALSYTPFLYGDKSLNPISSFTVLDAVNPGANFVIFFGLLGLVFFLTYERKKSKS